MTALRVVIADDHPVFREGLRTVIASTPDMHVVAEVGSGAAAVDAARDLHPDVVVMDLSMPDMGGVEATRRIAAEHGSVAVVVLSMSDDDDVVLAALRAGARGYLLKGASRAEILRAIEAVAAGDVVLGPALATMLVEQRSAAGPSVGAPFPGLTERERQVLELVASGDNNAVIARRLGVSAKTVRNHMTNILTKLQVTDRGQAIIRAREAGMGRPN